MTTDSLHTSVFFAPPYSIFAPHLVAHPYLGKVKSALLELWQFQSYGEESLLGYFTPTPISNTRLNQHSHCIL